MELLPKKVSLISIFFICLSFGLFVNCSGTNTSFENFPSQIEDREGTGIENDNSGETVGEGNSNEDTGSTNENGDDDNDNNLVSCGSAASLAGYGGYGSDGQEGTSDDPHIYSTIVDYCEDLETLGHNDWEDFTFQDDSGLTQNNDQVREVVQSGGVCCVRDTDNTEEENDDNNNDTNTENNDDTDVSDFSWDKVKWVRDADVSGWEESSEVTSVEVKSYGAICIDHTEKGQWPERPAQKDGDVIVEGNPWIIVKMDGKYYASTYEWLRPGQVCKLHELKTKGGLQKLYEDALPDLTAIKNWTAKGGDVVGFMVSGLARHKVSPNTRKRTNIQWYRLPSIDGSISGQMLGTYSSQNNN